MRTTAGLGAFLVLFIGLTTAAVRTVSNPRPAGPRSLATAPRVGPVPKHVADLEADPPPSPPPPTAGPPLVYGVAATWPDLHFQQHPLGAILVDLDTRTILWGGDTATPRATASLGKIFTVMVALDHASLDDVVTVPPGGEDDDPTHSVMGLHTGDELTVRELVEGIWLASGDDAAETLARAFIPRDQFIAEMNAKAAMLGLVNTHLANPSGLDEDGQVSSPHDLAIAAGWLELHYPDAFALASGSVVPLPPNGHHGDLTLRTVNKMVSDYRNSGRPYPGITGLKTGDTQNAGGCMIATATRGGHHLIAVVMNDDWFFTDAAVLLDYGFAVLGSA